MSFKDKVVIVTGGTRGIGRGIVERFHEEGAHVAVCARRDPEKPLRDGDREAFFQTIDVRDPDQAESFVAAVREHYGRLDILINNAGGTPTSDVTTASPRFHRSIVDLNLLAPMTFSVLANRVMQEQDSGGSILFISSVAAQHPNPETAAYCAAKAGIDTLSAALAQGFAPKVRVNTITVGLVTTPDSGQFYGESGVDSLIPMGRMGTTRDVADACLLLSDPQRASWITGANLECHGGRKTPWLIGED
jgi:NAD(P)-dependent dehydrogenase (short-subunit alcohol dehydrogenase family)